MQVNGIGRMSMKNYTRMLPAALICALLQVGSFGAVADEDPPVGHDSLFQWLKAGNYKSWVSESKPHPSAGPHPQAVIAFLNESLNASLAAGNASHPRGAAAVKELFDGKGEISGWAVSVKTEDDSDGGNGWYWYEILGTTADSRVVADGNGVPLCFGCHTPGKDFVLIPHPLK
jgi:hypothetical protein